MVAASGRASSVVVAGWLTPVVDNVHTVIACSTIWSLKHVPWAPLALACIILCPLQVRATAHQRTTRAATRHPLGSSPTKPNSTTAGYLPSFWVKLRLLSAPAANTTALQQWPVSGYCTARRGMPARLLARRVGRQSCTRIRRVLGPHTSTHSTPLRYAAHFHLPELPTRPRIAGVLSSTLVPLTAAAADPGLLWCCRRCLVGSATAQWASWRPSPLCFASWRRTPEHSSLARTSGARSSYPSAPRKQWRVP